MIIISINTGTEPWWNDGVLGHLGAVGGQMDRQTDQGGWNVFRVAVCN